MELFFTKIDKDIERNIQKDPLREQVIWIKFANKLYPNINSTTGEMKGFIITALGLEIIDKFKQKYPGLQKGDIREIQVMYEMIIMYMLIEYIDNNNGQIDIGFLGKDRGTSYYKKSNSNPKIYMKSDNDIREKQILVRQYQLGYIARYRSKLEDKEKRKKILDLAFGTDLKEFEDFFEKILKRRNEKIEYKKCFANTDIKNKFLEILEIKENKDQYLRILDIKDDNINGKDFILNKIITAEEKNENLTIENIIQSAIENKNLDKELKKLLIQIKNIESFLIPLNNLFFEVLDKEILEVNDQNIEKLKNAYANIKDNTEIQVSLRKYNNLIKTLSNETDNKEIVKAIIKDHSQILKEEKGEAWITITDNEELIINHKAYEDYESNSWKHYYFIDVVERIVRSMKPWKKN